MKGKFIVLEGIDGCGKSTQVLSIIRYFLKKSKYNHVLVTREPYKERDIRKILRTDDNPYTQAENLAELFISDRKEHIIELIEPALNKGVHVVSDRYKYSTTVYQSAQGLPLQELIDKHKDMPTPDLVLIFDVPVEVAIERMSKDKRKEHKFESSLEFQKKLRESYLKLPEIFPEENIVVIDGTKTVGEVSEEARKILDKYFK